ncbi:ATP-grasp domain-containing protein [Uruburuella testudinis]|uniref:ATP-grasp domain-containing protein n=1 Tax=Uruburuella testudinis TaxID=1282863 RepID=A0ABY4DV99_9NEIS|nr:ATP-grasp domain-containing protein [Uruburuella testudinis]UOO81939.1 ATP-grasp domain-containing protein [Uruburuella testudinis]
MNTLPHIGFLGPQAYMAKAIADMSTRMTVHKLYPQSWDEDEMDAVAAECRRLGIGVVAGFAQKDAFHHILINERLGNTAPLRLAFLYCMNKYLMRTLEADPFWFDAVDPLHESDEEIIAKIKEWPFMLKNTSLSLGRGIFKIKNERELKAVLADYRADTGLQALIAHQNQTFMQGIAAEALPPVVPPFIAEHMVDMNSAIEYCYEGYITTEGEIVHYALTEEIYFSNHQALGYLTPPMSIDAAAASKIEAWVNNYMGRMAALGYVGQFFNLEFWMMPNGSIALTEINPRAAHSYHYNYLYSFGNSLYEDNLALAAGGRKLPGKTPWQKWRDGDDFQYTLIVLITGKTTGKVADILDYDYVDALENREGILIRHNRGRNDILTDSDMTAAGVMLLQLWITGATQSDMIAKEREIRSKIYRQAQAEAGYPPYWQVP